MKLPAGFVGCPQSTTFVKADGQGLTLNGAPYTIFAANSYWVGLMGLTTNEMNITFQNIAATGGTTLRTWQVFPLTERLTKLDRGFNEVTTASGDYYQLWNGSTPTINYGLTGLENFDNVVAATKANDNCLIVTLGTTSIVGLVMQSELEMQKN